MRKLTIKRRAITIGSLSLMLMTYSCAKQDSKTTQNQSSSNAKVSGDCTSLGWASQNGGTTGGSGTATVVSSYQALAAAIKDKNVKVIQVSGTITIPDAGRLDLKDQTDKTIFGDPGSKLVSNCQSKKGSGIMYIKRSSNIILRNLTFEGPGAYDVDGQDNCTIEACKNVLIDHCEFRDGVDGNLDIKKGSSNITVSWTKFTYLKAPKAGGSGGSDDHRFCNLIGSSDKAGGTDRGNLNITFARCWWAEGCVERQPRVRFGKVHVLNSLFNSSTSKKAIAAGFEANILVEGNVFENVKNPIAYMANNHTAVEVKNNLFTNCSGTTEGSGKNAFTPPYSYTAIPADHVKAYVTKGAGATLTASSDCSASSF